MADWRFDPKVDLPRPTDLDSATRERDAWCTSAMQFSINADYYRGQRDAFLRAALEDPAVAAAAERIVGSGWRRLLEEW